MVDKTARKVDHNGYLTVVGCPISSFGIFDYSAGQIGLDGDPNRIVKVYRPERAVSNPRTIESIKNLPLINDHEFLSGDDNEITDPEEYGVEGITTSDVRYEKPWLKSDLKIFSRSMRKALDDGKIELSLGYDCDYTLAPGVFEGEDYEVVQDNMIGNHLALVDAARVRGAKVLDGRACDYLKFDILPQKKELSMKRGVKKGRGADSTAVELLRKLVPTLNQFLKEEGTEPEHQTEMQPEEGETDNEEMLGGGEETLGDEHEEEIEEGEEVEEIEETDTHTENPELVGLLKKLVVALETELGMSGEGEDEGEEFTPIEDGVDPEGGTVALDEEECNVSPGPKKGKNAMAADADTIRRDIYKDMAAREALYKKVRPVIGAFDSASMSCADLAQYSIKKLGLKATADSAIPVLEAYLKGASVQGKTETKKAADSAKDSGHPAIDSYINGGDQ